MLVYDGEHIPVPDQSLDLLVCTSVLEHVPLAKRAALAVEMRRVAEAIFCQTRTRSFLIEPRFLMCFMHWLPRSLAHQLIQVSPRRLPARPGAATIDGYWWGTQLLGLHKVQELFPGARIEPERMFGLTKSCYVTA